MSTKEETWLAPYKDRSGAAEAASNRVCCAEDRAFDAYAAQYEQALQQGLSISGEGPEYFADRRIAWLQRRLRKEQISKILDFGCGVGIATRRLREVLMAENVMGFDPSSAAIRRASQDCDDLNCKFTDQAETIPRQHFDLVYCNGVFHHILPPDRHTALRTVWKSLRPGGWFAFWENNPWNPGTRFVMSRIPFDRDAVVISPRAAKSLLRRQNFQIHAVDAWFIFPRALSWLRPLEHLVHKIPIGAQYLVLARKSHN